MPPPGFLQELESLRAQVETLTHELAQRRQGLRDLHNIVETVPDFLFTLDIEGRLVTWNRAVLEATGYAPEELRCKPALEFVPPEERDNTAEAIQRVFATGYAEIEGHLLTKAGRCVPYHWTGAALKNETGEVIGISGMGRDVTERVRAEGTLRTTQFAMDHAVDAIYWIDPQAHIHYTNHTASRMLGYSADEFRTMTVHDLNPDFHAAMWPQFWEETKTQKTCSLETAHRAKDGRLIPVEIHVNYLAYGHQAFHCVFVRDITERKRRDAEQRHGEEILRESEERFRRVFEEAPLGMCIVGRDKRLLRVNRRLCEIVGYTESELLGRTYEAYTHPDDLPKNLQLTEEFFLGERAGYELEKRYRCKSGKEKWVKVTTTSIAIQDRIEPVLLAMIEEITERKRADAKIRDSETRLNEAQRIAHIGSWELQLETDRLTWSDEIYRIFEIDPEKFGASYDAFLTAVHPEDRTRVNQAYLRSVQQRTPYDIVHRLLMPDGRVKYVHERCETLYSPQGVPIKSLGTVQDITDRKQAELAVEERERLFRTLAEVAPVGIIRTDHTGACQYVNDRWCQISGMRMSQAMGEGWLAAVHPADRERVMAEWAAAIGGSRAFKSEYRFQAVDRRITWVVGQAQAERNVQGMVNGYVGTVTDITEAKQLEAALQNGAQALRAVMDERERLGQDLHDDILQSLYAVGLNLESCKSLLRQPNPGQADKTLTQAIQELNRIMRDVRGFIAGMGSNVITHEDFCGAMRVMIQTLTVSHSLSCTVSLNEDAVRQLAPAHAMPLLNIVREALSNALRHSQATKLMVSLRLMARSVRVIVSDNGRGFDPESPPGNGHGLANIKARILKLGGRVSIRSAKQKGASVTIYLPREDGHAD